MHSFKRDRENARQKAAALVAQGNFEEARKYQQRSVDVTHEMALELIKRCREVNVDCIVAPYEADAQLAYLNKVGLAEYVITEDSDLILFGCRKILFKLDAFGKCDFYDVGKLHLSMDGRMDRHMGTHNFSMDKFRMACILSVNMTFKFKKKNYIYSVHLNFCSNNSQGCDYIDSLPGIGLTKALGFVTANKDKSLGCVL